MRTRQKITSGYEESRVYKYIGSVCGHMCMYRTHITIAVSIFVAVFVFSVKVREHKGQKFLVCS